MFPINDFKNGSKLLLKSYYLVIVAFIVWTVAELFINLHSDIPGFVRIIFFYLFIFITLTFEMTVPLYLIKREKNQEVKPKEFIDNLIHNGKRLFLPAIGVSIFFVLLIIISLLILWFLFGGINPERFKELNADLWIIFISALFVPFIFTAVYFSLEKKGLFRSFVDSLVFSFKHKRFLLLAIVISTIQTYLVSFLPSDQVWLRAVKLLSSELIQLWVSASALLFYQRIHQD